MGPQVSIQHVYILVDKVAIGAKMHGTELHAVVTSNRATQ
jgi:hypothetical protein